MLNEINSRMAEHLSLESTTASSSGNAPNIDLGIVHQLLQVAQPADAYKLSVAEFTSGLFKKTPEKTEQKVERERLLVDGGVTQIESRKETRAPQGEAPRNLKKRAR